MGQIDIAIIAFYLSITLAVGVYAGRHIHTMREFAIGNRNYSDIIMVSTIFGTWVGGGLTLGMSEKIFLVGIAFIFVCFGNTLNKILVALFIAPGASKFHDKISVGDIMQQDYGQVGKIIAGISATLYCVGSLTVQIGAFGYLFNFFFATPPLFGILVGFGIVVTYSFNGGIRAVALTDAIQFIVLIVAIPALANIALTKVGGYSGMIEALPASHLTLFPEETNPYKYFWLFIIFALPLLEPPMMQRILMARDVNQIKRSLYICSAIEIPFYIFIGCIGLVTYILAPDLQSNLTIPHLINIALPVGIKGFVVAGMLAILMSTADSHLNAASVAMVHDVIKPLTKSQMSGKAELWMAKLVTLVLGIFAVIAATMSSNLVDFILATWNCWSAVTVVPLFATLFGYRGTPHSFVICSIAGFSTFFVWQVCDIEGMFGVHSLLPSLAVNFIAFTAVNTFSNRKKLQTVSVT